MPRIIGVNPPPENRPDVVGPDQLKDLESKRLAQAVEAETLAFCHEFSSAMELNSQAGNPSVLNVREMRLAIVNGVLAASVDFLVQSSGVGENLHTREVIALLRPGLEHYAEAAIKIQRDITGADQK